MRSGHLEGVLLVQLVVVGLLHGLQRVRVVVELEEDVALGIILALGIHI